MLSLLIYNKLWIFAVLFISADEKEIHICGDAKATVAAELTLKLIAKIRSIVIKELHLLPIRERVFHIDVAANKVVERRYLGHPLDM